MAVTRSGIGNATGDALVYASGIFRRTQTVSSDSKVLVVQTKTKVSDARVVNQQVSSVSSDAMIRRSGVPVSVSSDCKIVVNGVDLKLFKQSDLVTEVGTDSNPIEFAAAFAGATTLHSDNPFLLYNDKDGTFDSVDAKNIKMEVIEMNVVDEPVGVSDGTAGQVFSVAFPEIVQDETENTVAVTVGVTAWTVVDSLTGYGNSDQVCVVDYVAGTVTFGNNVTGAIPALGDSVFVTYTPNTNTFGVEARADGWFGVQSADVDRHNRDIFLDVSTVIDTTHVQLAHVPIVSVAGVQGVYLVSDPNRLGTNYFTSGSYNDTTGVVTLGTALPGGTTQVLVDYSYTITDDAEVSFSQLSKNVVHDFANPIPSKNAKKLNFHVVIPTGVSPTNGVKVKLRLRVYYTEY